MTSNESDQCNSCSSWRATGGITVCQSMGRFVYKKGTYSDRSRQYKTIKRSTSIRENSSLPPSTLKPIGPYIPVGSRYPCRCPYRCPYRYPYHSLYPYYSWASYYNQSVKITSLFSGILRSDRSQFKDEFRV
jgi:hypothetical protein